MVFANSINIEFHVSNDSFLRFFFIFGFYFLLEHFPKVPLLALSADPGVPHFN